MTNARGIDMKILITGITGMVGSHLADYVLQDHPEVEIHGLLRWRSPLDNIKGILDNINLHYGDLRDLSSLLALLKRIKPDRIFHLAAQSYVVTSFSAPVDTLTTNVIGTTNLLEAVRLLGLNPHILLCSSSEVYGQVKESEVPITETTPLRPASPYAVSKVAKDMLGHQYWLSYGMRIVRTRMFTHTGPRRGNIFAESSFAKQIAEIEVGKIDHVKVGNLESVRTICDVRDAVKAYWLTTLCKDGDVYNIGGETTLTIGDILNMLASFSTKPIYHEVSEHLRRPSDVTLQIPDTQKFRNLTGWRPLISTKQTMEDLLNYHRKGVHDNH